MIDILINILWLKFIFLVDKNIFRNIFIVIDKVIILVKFILCFFFLKVLFKFFWISIIDNILKGMFMKNI